MDIDGFFTELTGKVTAQDVNKGISSKLRPPTVLGDEQRRLYRELNEINKLAPERNDLPYMEHLCQLWQQSELEWI